MINYARVLKQKGWKLFILSNNFRERTKYYMENFSFLSELFDKVYFSWQTGYVKPSEDSFTNVLRENNLDPQNCYYFDDSEKNVIAAKRLGINAHKYSGLKETMSILEDT